MIKKLGQSIAQEVKEVKNRSICGYKKLGSSSKRRNGYNVMLYTNGSPHRGISWRNDDLNPRRTSFLIILRKFRKTWDLDKPRKWTDEAWQRNTKRVSQYFRPWWLHIRWQRSLAKGSNNLQKRWAEIEPWTADRGCENFNARPTSYRLCIKASSKYLHHRFVMGIMWWSTILFTNAPCVSRATGSFEPRGEADVSSRMCLCPEELSSLRCWQIVWLQACERKTASAELRRPSPVWERLGNTSFLENC